MSGVPAGHRLAKQPDLPGHTQPKANVISPCPQLTDIPLEPTPPGKTLRGVAASQKGASLEMPRLVEAGWRRVGQGHESVLSREADQSRKGKKHSDSVCP